MELYPIRIDVSYPPIPSVIAPTSSDANNNSNTTTTTTTNTTTSLPPMIRIIDTLMIDPKSLLDDELEKQNVVFTQWAHSIISDAFVVGVTKVPKPNNNTLSTGTTLHPNKNTSSTDANVPNTVSSASGSSIDQRIEFTGRYSLIDTTTGITNIVTASIHDTIGLYDSLMQQAIQQIHTQFCTIQQYERVIRHQHNNKQINTTKGTRNMFNTTSLIPIQLRLEIPSSDNQIPPIRYHDDFLWDPFHQSFLSPLQMAQSIVNDLHLSHDTIPIITIHILEQTILFFTKTMTGDHTDHVNDVNNNDDDDDDDDDDDEGIKMGPPILLQILHDNTPTIKTTAAWEISHAIHHTNMIHLETLQKQQQVTTKTTATAK